MSFTSRPILRRVVAVLGLALALGAGTSAPARGEEAPAREGLLGRELVLRALSLLGVDYKFGGNTPETGLDCSGLVRHVFREAAGLVLPRRAEEISRAGEVIKRDQLLPGDLVFFNTLRRAFSHVGIYVGEGRFIHAPSTGGEVRVESLSAKYWQRRFNGARRVQADIASAEQTAFARATNGFGAATAAGFDAAGPKAVHGSPWALFDRPSAASPGRLSAATGATPYSP